MTKLLAIVSGLTLCAVASLALAHEPDHDGNVHEHAYTNRLIDSRNPYLLLHAHNPVDWYPCGAVRDRGEVV